MRLIHRLRTISSESALPIYNTINIIKIKDVERGQATQLIKQKKSISIEIEGVVEGLLQDSGKIALHRKGVFLKIAHTYQIRKQIQNK